MRRCFEAASALHDGGTLWWQAQHIDECPSGAGIKRLLCDTQRLDTSHVAFDCLCGIPRVDRALRVQPKLR